MSREKEREQTMASVIEAKKKNIFPSCRYYKLKLSECLSKSLMNFLSGFSVKCFQFFFFLNNILFFFVSFRLYFLNTMLALKVLLNFFLWALFIFAYFFYPSRMLVCMQRLWLDLDSQYGLPNPLKFSLAFLFSASLRFKVFMDVRLVL